jgi:RNA polymerase sigma factor (sigma-70 family)
MSSAEVELLEAIGDGDRRAMRDLYELYVPRLWRFLYRVTGNVDMISELTNDVMLTVWQQAAGFRQESNFSTWILGIAYHKAVDAVRKDRRYKQYLGLVRLQPAVSEQDSGSISELIVNRDLTRLISGLTLPQRAVAELAFGFGYSYPEISEILDIPVNTVKSRMFAARRTMQDNLEGLPVDDSNE